MEDEMNLLNDYKDCINYINNFNRYNINELSIWVDVKYSTWISKNNLYTFNPSVAGVPSKDNIEKVENKLNNLKMKILRY